MKLGRYTIPTWPNYTKHDDGTIETKVPYYTKEQVETLKQNTQMSPSTWHKGNESVLPTMHRKQSIEYGND